MTSQNHNEPPSKTTIRTAAFKLLMANGIAGTSFSAIAQTSGQGRSLVHYYYPKKDQLVEEFFARLFECISEEAARIPLVESPEANLARGGQVYFAFLLKDEGTRKLTKEALSDRRITNGIIRLNGDWSLPQLGHPVVHSGPDWTAHVISNGGVFELLHERLTSDSPIPSSAELSAMSISTYLALCRNIPWQSTFNDLMPHMLEESETAPIVRAVSQGILS